MGDITEQLLEQVKQALKENQALSISGGHSKDFYGREIQGQDLSVKDHNGIVDYDPRELVLTARAGTTLAEIRQTLDEQNQMLPFEPPSFGEAATLGGTLACGFSGPRRPFAGSARDLVLGTQIINGKAEVLNFGGQVMKNVAGYDLSRLMVGAMGSLGVMLQASLKVLPKPEAEITLMQQHDESTAIHLMNELSGRNMPLSAAAYVDGTMCLRLSGVQASVGHAASVIGGERLKDSENFWSDLSEQRLDFFTTDKPLWRISVAQSSRALNLQGTQLIDWAGGLRWLISDVDAKDIQEKASENNGHAILFKNGDRQGELFQPLPVTLMKFHKKVKQSLDPDRLFNPGRMYAQL